MDPQYRLGWKVTLLLFLMPCGCQLMSVRIQTEDPAHVIPGSTLVLRAQIEHGPHEEVSMVTWEREPETESTPARVTLGTCSGKSQKCSGQDPNGRVSLEQQGATLKVRGYKKEDGGVYSLTVTDQDGKKTAVQCVVREYEAVHHVSVSINVSHASLVCAEAWGTDPLFSWLHERVAITKAVGNLSSDGKILYVSRKPICGHFTCIVTNKLGYNSASYTAEPCEASLQEGKVAAVAGVCLVILLVCGGALALLLWRRHKQFGNRGERLNDNFDDNI